MAPKRNTKGNTKAALDTNAKKKADAAKPAKAIPTAVTKPALKHKMKELPIRINQSQPLPSCRTCKQEYGCMEKDLLPERQQELHWRIFNNFQDKLTDEWFK